MSKHAVNKRQLLDKLISVLEDERANLAAAALHTYEAATHEESEPEDQYDTRGLEASYLAGAQAKRVAEVEQTLHTLKQVNVREYKEDAAIGPTAVVELDHDGKIQFCFLLPAGGGLAVDQDGHHIQVITPKSPLGEAIVGRTAGDVAVIDVGNLTKEYEIVSIF
jgi:transcription elongation GreA/GreB family factor